MAGISEFCKQLMSINRALNKERKLVRNFFTLYFIIPRTGSSTQLNENRTTLDLSFLISPDFSTNSIVKVFIKQRKY